MTDITPTPELINAAKWLRKIADQESNPEGTRHQAALLLQALPTSITEPLVAAPGRYLGYDKVAMKDMVVTVSEDGKFYHGTYGDRKLSSPELFGPYKRLVVGQPFMTRADVAAKIMPVVRRWHDTGGDLPTLIADEVAELVAGVDQ